MQVVGWLHHNCHIRVEVGYILRMWGVYKVQLQEVGSLPHNRHLLVEALDHKVHKVLVDRLFLKKIQNCINKKLKIDLYMVY